MVKYRRPTPVKEAPSRQLSVLGDRSAAHYSRVFWRRLYRRRKMRKLPLARAVTTLEICRHTTRIISPALLGLLLRQETLPSLTALRFEMWHSLDRAVHSEVLADLAVVVTGLSPKVRKLCVYVEKDGRLHAAPMGSRDNGSLAVLMAAECRTLTVLSAVNLFDGLNFFALNPANAAVANTWHYPNLQRLVLTSDIFDWPQQPRVSLIMALITQKIFRDMPKLAHFEIFGYRGGTGSAFEYSREPRRIHLTWRSYGLLDRRFNIQPIFGVWETAIRWALPGVAVSKHVVPLRKPTRGPFVAMDMIRQLPSHTLITTTTSSDEAIAEKGM